MAEIKPTVLLVDDESELLDLYSTEFEYAGFSTLRASNGKEAYQLFQKEKIDVVVSDVRMPGGDGVELLEKIKKTAPNIPVILVTGYADITLDQAIKKGAATLISKPADYDDLIATVQKSIDP